MKKFSIVDFGNISGPAADVINNFNRIIKEFTNQIDIVRIAVKDLEPDSKPKDVSDDWITFFFDKVKNVNEDYMKEIWAKILAGGLNKPNTYTKQLLHTMSIMDTKIAKRFMKIRSSCFYSAPYIYAFVYKTNGEGIR